MDSLLRIAAAACVVFLTAAESRAADPVRLRVMSFNIRYGTADDGENSWPHRRDLVVDTIRDFDPDLLGTQETVPFQADWIAEHLPGYTRIGWSRDASADGEQCTIFVRTDRFEVVDSGQFWLSETPDEPHSRSWDSSLPRITTWVILRDRSGAKDDFVFANTHFDHRGRKARLESAHLLVERASGLSGAPIILTGDFNCGEGSEPWQVLTESGIFRDTWRVVHPEPEGPEGTFNGFRGHIDGPRIDWILVTRHFDVHAADIVRTHREERWPSDHCPVTAVLSRH